jgi:hypothetical protein
MQHVFHCFAEKSSPLGMRFNSALIAPRSALRTVVHAATTTLRSHHNDQRDTLHSARKYVC